MARVGTPSKGFAFGDSLERGEMLADTGHSDGIRSGSVLMVGAADAGLVIRSEPATASAQANDKCLRMRNPPSGR